MKQKPGPPKRQMALTNPKTSTSTSRRQMGTGSAGRRRRSAAHAKAIGVPAQGWRNVEIGCKTSEVALALLAQLAQLEHPTVNPDTVTDDEVEATLTKAAAMLVALEPTTATEALLAAQMVGTQRAAMIFLARATVNGQSGVTADAHVLRATRLMRLFNEQVMTMERLKGRAGQQRVVVEHVTVAAGGQAIVGAVTPGRGEGARDDDPR